ncbi:MAG: metal ABC transporter substrate-binding protein [Salinibacter sp.]
MAHFGSDRGRWSLVLGGMLLLLIAACGGDPRTNEGRPHFVTTIPPFEMILRPVVEGRGTVERLLAPGASPHTYDPSPSDLRATTRATALVYGAAALDGWAADLPAARRLGLLDLLPSDVRLAFDGPGSRGAPAVDPHFWTDPEAVRRLLPALTDTLCAIDASGCPTYRANADAFAAELAALNARLRSIVRPVRATPVFLARPFFRYFLRRYGPRLVGVVEPRPGAEPTPRQLHRLVRRARASGARAILTQQSLSARVARAIAEPTALPTVPLDPMGGTAGRATYAALLLTNAQILRDSLAATRDASGSARRPGR